MNKSANGLQTGGCKDAAPKKIPFIYNKLLVGAPRFELGTPSPPDWCDKGCAHMKPSVIVWDLETVPDLPGFAAANDLVGKRDADLREALGNRFPKHIYHTIVCIGALVAHRESRRGW
jgi:hypothetical protein